MRKMVYIVLLMMTGVIEVAAQPRLSWRMVNPRIVNDSAADWLEYDIQVRNDTPSKFLSEITVAIEMNNTGLSQSAEDIIIEKGSAYDTLNSLGNEMYTLNAGITEQIVQFSMAVDSAVGSMPTTAADFAMLPTDFETWATVKMKITDPEGVAGLVFSSSGAGGFSDGLYRDSLGTSDLVFRTPHLIETKNFSTLYLSRIFSSLYGFTQIGGTNDWSVVLNTSIWDTVARPDVADVTVKKLRIHTNSPVGNEPFEFGEQPGGKLSVRPGYTLTVNDSLSVESEAGLVIESDSTGYGQLMDNGVYYRYEGTVQANAWFGPGNSHLYTPAIVLENYFNFYGREISYYNELDSSNAGDVEGPYHSYKKIINFETYPFDTIEMPVMTGYMIMAPDSLSVVVPDGPVISGDVSRYLTKSPWITQYPPYDGWNLVGNPYPSAIDLSREAVGWGGAEMAAWLWDPEKGNYLVLLPAGEGTYDSTVVAPQQGFFIRMSSADIDSGLFMLDNAVRTLDQVPFLKQETADLLRLKVVSGTGPYEDNLVVRFSADATDEYDDGLDAWKKYSEVMAPEIYTLNPDSLFLTVNALPSLGEDEVLVPMNFIACDSTSYTITASNTGSFTNTSILLEDKLLNQTQDLISLPEYTFSYSTGDNKYRFVLHFLKNAVGIEVPDNEAIRIWSGSGSIYILNNGVAGKAYIYDLTGRLVYTSSLHNATLTVLRSGLPDGIYGVVVDSGEKVYSRKVLLDLR